MTKEEAIAKAALLAQKEGWPWAEPIFAKKERPFIVFGRPYWRVMSHANRRGGNVHVRIDCKTGEIVSKGLSPR
jgi:hypothetical protein